MHSHTRLPALTLSIVFALPLTAQSLEKEAALGRHLADEIRQHTTRLNSPGVEDYVNRAGQRLTPHIRGAEYPFVFSVIVDDPCGLIHEPEALPGGYVFVPAALLLAAQDEGEFAGMLAHAMAHVAQRHTTRSGIPLVFLGCSDQMAIPRAYLPTQRENEEEADAVAVEATSRAGFDPAGLIRYIERVQPSASASRQGTSPLPDRDDRLAKMRSLIDNLQPQAHTDSNLRFPSVQEEVRRLINARIPGPKPPPTLRRTGSR